MSTGILLGILSHTWLQLTISALRLIRPTELRSWRVLRLFSQKLTSIFAAISHVYIQLLGKDICVRDFIQVIAFINTHSLLQHHSAHALVMAILLVAFELSTFYLSSFLKVKNSLPAGL